MESTFISFVFSNRAAGIVILVILLAYFGYSLYEAFMEDSSLILQNIGLGLLVIYMAIIWIWPDINTANIKLPVNIIGIAGFICLIAGLVVRDIVRHSRRENELYEVNKIVIRQRNQLNGIKKEAGGNNRAEDKEGER